MTLLIWMFTWLLQEYSAMCDLPASVNVTLQPFCPHPDVVSRDTQVSVVLCLLVVLSGICMALLVHTGFICLNKPLPEILDNDPKHTSRL
ncbi:hypothetical protein J4Q44_G00371460 [Coregonus suidteri]|uniref:Uncharacterized protein n=1 Tax=Coregonus suidteri TaxID=861788 RepID=A0AAN8KHH6_9TELE